MAKIVTNAIRKTYKDLIKQVIADLGESIFVYGPPEEEDCPNCLSDLVTGESKNIYDSSFTTPVTIFGQTVSPQPFNRGRCPICKGVGKLKDYSPVTVRALVKWRVENGDMENTPVGIEGQNLVRIKARSTYYDTIRDAEYVIIDGVRCELYQPPVFRGLGQQDEMVVAFFKAVEPGHSVKE